ncbi:hypothetical protein [Dysgonomonas sp. ZJ709]|uniref:hypothetical protein n=1 Tax=Dysgonomonas sp. ZJ709 TaxID=2709797 RepID=UPI0013EAADC5|nr:hypothetical protein [Dysgonomonas sp. ZJ709]
MIKVKDNQTLIDVAIQASGSIEGIFDLAVKNDLSITDYLEPGQELVDPDIIERQITDFFYVKGLIPATEDRGLLQEGIEYWYIEYDFIVS